MKTIRISFVFCCLLFAVSAAVVTGAFAANTPTDAPKGTTNSTLDGLTKATLSQVWQTRLNEFSTKQKEIDELLKQANEKFDPLGSQLGATNSSVNEILSLFQMSRGHPTEQLTLLFQMRRVQGGLLNEIQDAAKVAALVEEKLIEVAQLNSDVDLLTKTTEESVAAATPSESGGVSIAEYRKGLAGYKKKLAQANATAQKILRPANETSATLDKSISDIVSGMGATWKNYYFTTTETSFDSITSSGKLAGDWFLTLASRMSFAYPKGEAEWYSTIQSFFTAIVVIGLIGAIAYRQAHNLPGRWCDTLRTILKRSFLWCGLGSALMYAGNSNTNGMYLAFVISGVLFLIWGIAELSWRLRVAELPELASKPLPLGRLYPPAALGVLMLYSDMPSQALSLLWLLILVAFIYIVQSINKKHPSGSLPWLERILYSCSLLFGVASVIVSIVGFPRMAILIFMLLFALANTITLGTALMGVTVAIIHGIYDKEKMPVRNTILQAILIPVSWGASLLCTIPWLWAAPGASYVVDSWMTAGYTIGDASFDVSRIIFIIFLFFLVRSLISVGKTSLAHLPDRMPYIERGVIPPLQTMASYAVWGIFILFALNIVGVSFTSLAVVAGGLSVGIGFGMQNIFNNLVSGLMLIFGRTVLVGDFIEIAGTTGTVKEINIRSTTIETNEMALVYVPNSSLMSGQFTNWTRHSRRVRKTISVGVAYGSDLVLVQQVLRDTAKEHEHVIAFPEPIVQLINFNASSVDFNLVVIIDDFSNVGRVLSDLRVAIAKAFDKHKIEMPFPQLDLHLPQESVAITEEALRPLDTMAQNADQGRPVSDKGPDVAPSGTGSVVAGERKAGLGKDTVSAPGKEAAQGHNAGSAEGESEKPPLGVVIPAKSTVTKK